MSGSFKGVFVHGVLTALEEVGLRAEAYAAASSSTLPTACATVGRVRDASVDLWIELASASLGMSEVVRRSITALGAPIRELLFSPQAPRLIIAASRVTTPEAAALTQGPGARRLGRQLLLDAARHNTAWRDLHLEKVLFDTHSLQPALHLTPYNFDEVAYATTRMLHAWSVPAAVDGVPYVDASYTTLCPALELVTCGYRRILAIATEPGPLNRDLFSTDFIPSHWNGAVIETIQPACNLKDLGVDFTSAAPEGLRRAFAHGMEQGRRYAQR